MTLVRENAVDLPDDAGALLLVELEVVDGQQLIDALVLEAGDIVVVVDVGERRREGGLGIRKSKPTPRHVGSVGTCAASAA